MTALATLLPSTPPAPSAVAAPVARPTTVFTAKVVETRGLLARIAVQLNPYDVRELKLCLDYELLDSGCCGMAGSWGYEKGEHYDVSMKAGERVLLPAVRNAGKDALIVTDGFSCRSQIKEATDRSALHLAQVIQMALHDGEGPARDYPESEYSEEKPVRPELRSAALLGAGVALTGGALAWIAKKAIA